jgi:exodeoxyribonuclease VII large subunit
LFAFNDEALVRAVAACPVPIISAVGHETDTTLCDYAADLRAPTPSAAAETSVPDRFALMQGLADKEDKLGGTIDRIIKAYAKQIVEFSLRLDAHSPSARLDNAGVRINNACNMLDKNMSSVLERKRMKLASAVGLLEGVNPLSVIKRGYSMTLDENGKIVSSVEGVSAGDGISVRVKDGNIFARVESKTEENDVGKN